MEWVKSTSRCTLLCLLLLITAVDLSAYDYSGGSGSESSPYQIANKTDLKYLSEHSNEWLYHFIQTANITFTEGDFAEGGDFYNGGTGFVPIGDDTDGFFGSYNGQNHTIDGLSINRPNTNHIGLFGRLQGSTVRNLGVTNVDITGKIYTGGLVGFCIESSSISNCYSTGTVNGYNSVGGLVGLLNESPVTNSYSNASVTGLDNYVGGLVGFCFENSSISNCYSTGNVSGLVQIGGLVGTHSGSSICLSFSTGSASGDESVGGLVGYNLESASIRNCYSTGNVIGDASSSCNIGGLVGTHSNSSIDDSYSIGRVSGTCGTGGLVGDHDAATVNNSFWNTQSSEQNSSEGGTGKSTAEMKSVVTFTETDTEGLTTAWDFITNPNDDSGNNDYWDIDLSGTMNNGYPYLNWEDGEDVSLPVEITVFKAENQSGYVILQWTTESETENLGFIIQRKITVGAIHESPSEWLQIASYIDNKSLEGHGSTTQRHYYQYTDKQVQPGATYLYRLADVNYGGKVTWHDVIEIEVKGGDLSIPDEFALLPAYPNPFNPSVAFRYSITEAAKTSLKVYNQRGQLVETLISTYQPIGTYDFTWRPQDLSSGVYIVKLQSGNRSQLQKIVYVK